MFSWSNYSIISVEVSTVSTHPCHICVVPVDSATDGAALSLNRPGVGGCRLDLERALLACARVCIYIKPVNAGPYFMAEGAAEATRLGALVSVAQIVWESPHMVGSVRGPCSVLPGDAELCSR